MNTFSSISCQPGYGGPIAPRTMVMVLAWLSCLGTSVGQVGAQAPPDGTFEFHHDFRGRPLPPELKWHNVDDDTFFHQEPKGLRIAIPPTWVHPFGGIGVRTTFGISGDFEVTTAFEILEAETPPKGYGVGIYLHLAKPVGGVPGKPVPRVIEGTVPCADKSGRFRLKRVGTTLHFLWAPGIEGGQFDEIHQLEFGDGPVQRVRLAGLTGREPCNLDVRLLDLRIRSQTSGGPAAVAAAAAPTPSRSRWPLVVASLVILAIVVAGALALRRGRRQVHGS